MAEDRRTLAPFSAIQSKAPFPITVHVESKGSALITASSEYADKLHLVKTDVHNDTLIISYTGQQTFSTADGALVIGSGANVSIINGVVYINGLRVENNGTVWRPLPDVRIHVTTPALRSITVDGMGSVMTGAAELIVSHLAVNSSGAGQVILPSIRADSVHATVSGAGQVDLVGTARRLSAAVSGAGQMNALALPVEDADVRVSGTGQAYVKVTRRLSGGVSGMGAMGYQGTPQMDVRQSSTGQLYQIP